MILASASPIGLLLGGTAALAYATAALAARAVGAITARRVLVTAWVLHGLQLAWTFAAEAPRFGFAQTLSITVWLVLTVYAVESRLYPRMPARWTLAGFGTVTIMLALLFPGAPLPETSSPLLGLHWALGLAAYGLFGVAVAHGWLMNRAERQMRQAAGAGEGGVPLLTLERLMFRFIWAGFILLTLTLLAGLFFGEQLYGAAHVGWRWTHKNVFTVLSWVVFAVLLLGRWRFGWRGRHAVQVLYAGAALLLLGYAGSRFVMEVLLGRAP